MELFKFRQMNADGYMSEGQAINGTKSVMWVERYRDPGEFKIVAPISKRLYKDLPVGTLISHVDTLEVMIVENIEIDEEVNDKEPEMIISGRSLESWFKHRIVGEDIETYEIPGGGRLTVIYFDFVLTLDTSWAQAVTLLERHIGSLSASPEAEVPGFVPVSNQQHIGPSTTAERVIRRQDVHRALLELLAIDDFGIRSIRPNSTNTDPLTTEFRIHNGFDRTDSVIFSHAFGDLDKARYFWSDKGMKTDFHSISNYLEMRSDSASHGFYRRTMLVDCSDLDNHLTEEELSEPGVSEFIEKTMNSRGNQSVRGQQASNILSTDISKTTKYKFREHYDVGDIVTVNGNHGVSSIMRVTEHAEFEDENGETGYPTLSAVNE